MIARAMIEPRTCVVEVTQIVPADDVPYVAARVAERLGMPFERVRKLIDGRTGPITRPLRPDKADAIAQTFEAAGVSVVMRPATEDDVFTAPPSQAAPEPPRPPESVVPSDPREQMERQGAPEPAASPVDAEEASPPGASREAESAPEVWSEAAPAPEEPLRGEVEAREEAVESEPPEEPVEPEQPELPVEPESPVEPEPPEPPFEPEQPVEPVEPESLHEPPEERPVEEWSDDPPDGFAEEEGDGEGVVIDLPDDQQTAPIAGAEQVEAVQRLSPFRRVARVGPAAMRLDPEEDDDDHTNDPGEFGWHARGEVGGARLTAASFPVAASEVRLEGPDEPRLEDPLVDEEAAHAGLARGTAPGPADPKPRGDSRDASTFGDLSSWESADDASAGWSIGSRARRRLEVVEDSAHVAELVDEPAGARVGPPEGAEAGAPPQTADAPPQTADAPSQTADAPPEQQVADAPGGDESELPEPQAPLIGRESRVRRTPEAEPRTQTGQHEGEAAAAGPVPTAWRGLGGGGRGPARPADARLPRRDDPADVTRAQRQAEVSVTRRRTIMLILLAVALGLFVLAQAWVAGRAAPAFEAGLHRFRDADFGAARGVWTDLAGAGDANAQFMLGYLSEAGLGRPWSARAAAAWYRLAADAGHAEAQWRLANLYEQGLGVPPDPLAAERWWEAAAAGGHAEAAFMLGRSRLEGASGVSDPVSALTAFERALELGWPAARPYRDALSVASEGAHADALP